MPMIPLHHHEALGINFWLLDIDAAPGDQTTFLSGLLSDTEQARADRFHFDRDARRYRASHAALRTLLSTTTGVPARELKFSEGPFGKPRLDAAQAPHFNMSHCGGWALIAIGGDTPIGVDIELQRPLDDLSALAQRNFTQAEFDAIQTEASDKKMSAFLRCWTRKEACLKALGSGLSIEPNEVEAGIEPHQRATQIQMSGRPCRMSVVSLALPIQALAAVAWVAGADRHLAL